MIVPVQTMKVTSQILLRSSDRYDQIRMSSLWALFDEKVTLLKEVHKDITVIQAVLGTLQNIVIERKKEIDRLQ